MTDQLRALLDQRLAAALAEPAPAAIPRRADPAAPVPLTPAQARMWFLTQLDQDSPAYHVRLVLRLRGPLDREAMLGAVHDLAERHEVLRCLIIERDGRPVAEVGPADAIPAYASDVRPEQLDALIEAETERPFALADAPPMRAALLCTADEAVLALTFHHIAVDGFSMARVRAELAGLYAARLGLAGPLPPADQYTDYAAWLAADTGAAPELLDWWERTLSGLAPILDLPTDRPRQPVAGAEGGEVPVCIPADLTERMRQIATRTGGTPFMVLLAAWQALLGRLCRTTDVPVGVAESGRHHPGADAMIGCFINTVVMRTDLAGDPTGAQLLARVREVALEGFAHAEAPFEQVVDRLAADRNPTAAPVVQALLNVLGPDDDLPAFPGLDVESLERAMPSAKSDLGLTLARSADGYTGALSYRRDLFDPATAERIAAWYLAMLGGMLADLDQPVGAIPLGSQTGPVLVGPPQEIPPDTLHVLVEGSVDRTPDAPAVVGPDGRLSYAELDRLANRIAHALIAAGVGPNDPVGVLLEPSTVLAGALLGVLKAGAGYLPMDASYPAGRVASILATAGARVLLTVREFATPADHQVLVLDDPATLAGHPDHRPNLPVRPDHLLHVIFTSGSTGAPKGVAVEHRSIVGYLTGMREHLAGVAGGSFGVLSTISADLGHTALHGALITGGVVHLVARETATDPVALAGYLAEHPIDAFKLVPSHLELLATHGDLSQVLPQKLLLLAGEACSWSLIERAAAARPGLRIQSHYGPTETSMICMVTDIDDVPAELRTGIVPLGRMLPNMMGWLVDGAGRPVPPGVPGELLVGGPGVARGYLGAPELTARSFVEHAGQRVYRVGDLLRIRADGFVEFRGRVDDQVKVRGYRVEPGEVAAALRALPGVAEAVVLPVGDGHQRKLAAWLVPAVGHLLDAADLRTRLRERLPDYLVPASLTVLDRMPLNPNGKVDRAALPAPTEADRPAGVAPRTPTEHRLAAVWMDILGLDELGIDDDFFTLGGDSFAAVRAVRAADPALRVIDLFTRPTVRQLAEHLDRAVGSGSGRLLHRLRAAANPTATVVCVPYGGGSAAVYQPLAHAMPPGFAVLSAELPGHDPARPDEALIPLPELVDRLAGELAEAVTGPIVLYGHCVGAAVAVALARRLEADGRAVLGVVVAGSFPTARLPGRLSGWVNRVLPVERWASNRLYRDILRATGGLLDDMDEAATEAALRGMRHDTMQSRAWFSAELAGPRVRLSAPILCVVGARDRATELYRERYAEWGAFAERVELVTLPRAGHYFLRHQASELAGLITGRVRDWSGGRLPAPVPAVAAVAAGSARPGLRAFYTVAGGQFVSMLGNALSLFALEVWAYQRNGRVLDLALVTLLATLPAVLATPLGGALADRVDRRRIMLAADLVCGVAMAVLAVLLATGRLTLPAVCVIVTVTSVATAFHLPAYLAAIAQLVPKPYLPQANALAQLGLGVGTVLGPMAGGALIALVGLPGVVAVDVGSFAIGFGTLLLVRFPNRLFHRQEESFRRAITGGWRFIARRRPLLLMIGFAAVLNLFASVVLVAVTPLVLSFAGVPALGLVTTIGGIGAAVAGILMLPWGGTRRRAVGMIAFTIGVGAGTVLMGLHASVPVVALGLAIRMGSMAIMNAHWLSIIQVKVGQELQGRVMATNLMLALATQPIGFLAAGPVAARLSPSPGHGMALLMLITGGCIVAWGVIGLCTRPLRRLEDALPDATPTAEIADDLDAVQAEADQHLAA